MLLIHYFLLLHSVACVGSLVCNVKLLVLSSFAIISMRRSELLALSLIVFVLLCGCLLSLFHLRNTMGWRLVCDSGIFWSYSLV